jgi:hypothetical protein
MALLLFCACGAPPPPPPPALPLAEIQSRARPTGQKVALIGIDGASFSVLRPLAAEGRLPNLERLIRGGAHGVLESEKPMISPAIWTTIATGRQRSDHGIEHFVQNGGALNMMLRRMKLVRSTDRRVSALWNWPGLFDKSVGFQGWWASWPAEPVNGWIISDRLPRTRWTEWTDAQRGAGLTYPAELIEALDGLIVDPADPPMDEIDDLLQMNEDERREFDSATAPIFAHSLSVFKFAYCAQRSYEQIGLRMIELGQPDVLGIFLIATDPISHTFWHYFEPDAFDDVDRETAARLGRLVPRIYEHNDRYLGELLAQLDPDTTVFVVSDHGFQASGKIPHEPSWIRRVLNPFPNSTTDGEQVAAGQSGKHDLEGIFMAHGPNIREGVSVRPTIYDVAPTIMALLGLPIPADTDGRVLTEIIDPAFLAQHPVMTIPSYDPYFTSQASSAEVDDDQIMENLRSLGYVE